MALKPLLRSIRDLLFRMLLARAGRHYPADAAPELERTLRRPPAPNQSSAGS